jgi:hypothetical protein
MNLGIEHTLDALVHVDIARTEDAIAVPAARGMGSSKLASRLWLPLTLTLSPFALKKRDGEKGCRQFSGASRTFPVRQLSGVAPVGARPSVGVVARTCASIEGKGPG